MRSPTAESGPSGCGADRSLRSGSSDRDFTPSFPDQLSKLLYHPTIVYFGVELLAELSVSLLTRRQYRRNQLSDRCTVLVQANRLMLVKGQLLRNMSQPYPSKLTACTYSPMNMS